MRSATRQITEQFPYQLAPLRALIKPFRLVFLATVGSTNTWAAQKRRAKALYAPSVVLTSRQTAGRGRGLNVWTSPHGVMTATFVLPINDALPPNLIPLAAGLAVRDAATKLGARDAGLKWPNDVWVDGLKLAGLLCERVDGVDLIGVGLNVNLDPQDLPAHVRSASTSLRLLSNQLIPMNRAVSTVATCLEEGLMSGRLTPSTLVREYNRTLTIAGLHVRVTDEGQAKSGVCEGVDSQGRLLLRIGPLVHRLLGGTVRVEN